MGYYVERCALTRPVFGEIRTLSPLRCQQGDVAERPNAPVLKTGDGKPSEGSNPSVSAHGWGQISRGATCSDRLVSYGPTQRYAQSPATFQ